MSQNSHLESNCKRIPLGQNRLSYLAGGFDWKSFILKTPTGPRSYIFKRFYWTYQFQGCRNWWCWWCYSTTNNCQFSKGVPLIAPPMFWQVKYRTIVAPPIFHTFWHPWYLPTPNNNNFLIDLYSMPISQNIFSVWFVIQNLEKTKFKWFMNWKYALSVFVLWFNI